MAMTQKEKERLATALLYVRQKPMDVVDLIEKLIDKKIEESKAQPGV
jgi:hypothetical protein|nr:MAG TPA: hypothetical protein [Caudoviricetes sp.]